MVVVVDVAALVVVVVVDGSCGGRNSFDTV